MANLLSIGHFKPSGLQYLISEGFLKNDCGPQSYKWLQQMYVDDDGQVAAEEVLRVDHCVVWSRHGIIKRVYNLDIEAEQILHAFTTYFDSTAVNHIQTAQQESVGTKRLKEPALVVVLKTQAHIFCLSGPTHVIPLSFETARAFPSLHGCLLQPQASSVDTPPAHKAASNMPRWHGDTSIKSWSSQHLEEGRKYDRATATPKKLPTFCITGLLSDVGLVAVSYNRRPKDIGDCPFLPADEMILYASSAAHMSSYMRENVCVAVTMNKTGMNFTVWQIQNSNSDTDAPKDKTDSVNYRPRQSSNYHERARVISSRAVVDRYRDSFGGLMQSFVETEPKPSSSQLSNIENLAAELGQDFDSTGVQTRSARRISSMLARTDLAPATERSLYNDSSLTGRKSLSRALRHEGSIGSFTERNSLGARRSFAAGTSIYSNAASFIDAGPRMSFNEGVLNDAEKIDHELAYRRLDKNLTFVKLKTVPCHESSTQGALANVKVLLIPHPENTDPDGVSSPQLSVCIQESLPQIMTVVTITVKGASAGSRRPEQRQSIDPELKAVQVQRGNSIADACLVRDQSICRLLVLSRTLHGGNVLHLEAPWASSFRIELPDRYFVRSPYERQLHDRAELVDRVGSRRVIDGTEVKLTCFLSTFNVSNCSFQDSVGRIHNLQVKMQIPIQLDRRIIEICSFALPVTLQDSMLVAYWEVVKWLERQETRKSVGLAIAVTLFIMAIPSISSFQGKPATPGRKKKSTGKRLSGSSLANNTVWNTMQAQELTRQTPNWLQSPTWAWTQPLDTFKTDISMSPSKHPLPTHLDLLFECSHKMWPTKCTDLAIDFLQSPAGEFMTGPEGYLPTAINQDRNLRRTTLATTEVALYLLLEEAKLESPTSESLFNDVVILKALVIQLSIWLGWRKWSDNAKADLHASLSGIGSMVFDDSRIDNLDTPPEPFQPISLSQHIENICLGTSSKYHTLAELVRSVDGLASDDPLLLRSARLLPISHAVLQGINQQGHGLAEPKFSLHHSTLDIILGSCFSDEPIDPPSSSRLNAPILTQATNERTRNIITVDRLGHNANRDFHAMCNQALDTDALNRWDILSEVDRQTLTKLIFCHDRRFQEATKLVNQARPPEVEYDPQPTWTEVDALEAQKLLAQYATKRTFAVVSGRGLMHFNAKTPLLTEMVPKAQFSMRCFLKPSSETETTQPRVETADLTLFTEDKVSWAFFHNGASAGLMISKSAKFIDTSWILYNKPQELTNRHAGFLLALGLNGHLKTLTKWARFKYLTSKHTMTSVGLLLGLAASHIGTAHVEMTRVMSVHVTCLLPPGSAELNLSPLTQVTGLIGIGLIYHNTQHRRMSEIMISEIETQEIEERSADDAILKDEGYRLAAGIALGLINLGHGHRLRGLQDTQVVERLLAIAVGPKNVNVVHMLDRATAGAVVAVALIFLKTNDESIARKIDIPDTQHQFEYVRPDIFLLRTLARHLIMWHSIEPEQNFVEMSLPQQYRHRASLKKLKQLATNDLAFFHILAGICFAIALKFAGSQRHDTRDLLLGYLDQFMRVARLPSLSYDAKVTLNGIRNCLDILALSCATVMAGSGDLAVYRRLRALHGRLDKDTPYGSHLAAHMAIGALFLSGGTATFGTSNLAIASLVIAFYPLFPTDVLDNRGHLQALRHLWVLAAEHRCLFLRDEEDGQVLANVPVRLDLTDGSCVTLQTPGLIPELENISSMSVTNESFGPIRFDLDRNIDVTKDGKTTSQTVRDYYRSLSTGIAINVKRRSLYQQRGKDRFSAEMSALDATRNLVPVEDVFDTRHGNDGESTSSSDVGDWIFRLPSFASLDLAERDLVFSPSTTNSSQVDTPKSIVVSTLLNVTPVDTRLELETGTLGPEDIRPSMQQPIRCDKLWRVRLLLSKAGEVEQDKQLLTDAEQIKVKMQSKQVEQRTSGLREDLTERLRWRVWQMGRFESVE